MVWPNRIERRIRLKVTNVWRGRVLVVLSLVAAAAASAANTTAEESPWRYILARTLRDEEGLHNATLYAGDLTSRSFEAVYDFEPGFVIRAVIPNPTWEYAFVTGRTYKTAREVIRFCKVPLETGGKYEVVFEDRFRRSDDAIIMPAPEGEVFFLGRSFTVVKQGDAGLYTKTILYRYAPETGVEELAELEGYVALHGVAGENKLYVSYDERPPEGLTTIYGCYDLATGELTPSGFEPPDRRWNPGAAPITPPMRGEGPLTYTLGIVRCGPSYGIDYYIREPDEPGNYRRVIIENTTAVYVLCYGRDAIVYIPDLDVEENGIRIVTKYLDGTYCEPFLLPTDKPRGDIQKQRREYDLYYVEGEAPRGLVGLESAPPAWKSRSVYQTAGG